MLITEGLDKEQIGSFLGSPKQFNQECMYEFINFLDFSGLDVDSALRFLLSQFRLPGESQQIERILTVFTEHFSNDNPNEFQDKNDTWYLAYSSIMLNVNLHSSQIKRKMTKAEFINSLKGCTQNLGDSYIEQVYDFVLKKPF